MVSWVDEYSWDGSDGRCQRLEAKYHEYKFQGFVVLSKN
jgi:hypothetical protein